MLEVQPIIQAKCVTCHGPGGQSFDRPFETYAEVYASRSDILNQVYSCAMPLASATPLTSAERHTLLQWLVCRAPDN
jgi:uncharacterized membrane protein